MLFDSLRDKEFYMQNAMFVHQGKTWRFIRVDEWGQGIFHSAQGEGEQGLVTFDINEVSTRSFRTGYMVDMMGVLRYIERIPKKQWRVGITSGTVRDKTDARWRFNFLDTDWFVKMHDDNYPDVDEARDLAEDGKAHPFDYDFAIYKDSSVDYKGRRIGTIHNRKFLPLPGVEWIRELVDSVINRKFIGGLYGH